MPCAWYHVQVAQERSLREALVDFLLGVLDLDPQSRWTPRQALQHPFITGGIFQVCDSSWRLQALDVCNVRL
jgi:serine/threonine protein kinase